MKVAIVGASQDRSKFGNKAVRAYLKDGHTVYPVHPSADEVEGIACLKSVKEIPAPGPDRILVYVPEKVALASLQDFATFKKAEIWLNPGADSPPVVREARALGLDVIQACAIVDIGASPSEFP